MLFDTHCHIHDQDFPIDTPEVFKNMQDSGVFKAICVSVNAENSKLAVDFCRKWRNQRIELFATIGTHPHDTKDFDSKNDILLFEELAKDKKVVAVGEIGLDFYYNNSPKETQIKVLQDQIKFAIKKNLPISFHVRDAFDDFWNVFDECENKFGKIKGVLHSFTDSSENLEKALKRGLYIGVNGISTFTKDKNQLEMFQRIPLNKIVLETDSPFLAPAGKRGRKNQPSYLEIIAEDLAKKRNITTEEVVEITSRNASELFGI